MTMMEFLGNVYIIGSVLTFDTDMLRATALALRVRMFIFMILKA